MMGVLSIWEGVSWLGARIPAKSVDTGRGKGSPSSGGSTRVELRAMNIVSVTRQVSVTTVFRLTVSVVACVRFCYFY